MSVDWVRDEIILACDLVRQNDWRGLSGSDARVIDLSELLNASPLHPVEERDDKFRNPAGVGRKTWDIATRHPEYRGTPTNGNKLDRLVLGDFLGHPDRMAAVAAEIRASINSRHVLPPPNDDPDLAGDEAQEGRLLLARHLRRERNPKLRQRKISSTKAKGDPIDCEVCSFDFRATYGERGTDYIEVHHVLPLHVSGQVLTRLSDLALLCANCHRMIHRGNPWLTPNDLRSLLVGGIPASPA